MQIALILTIVVLSITILAVAGFWYFRDRRLRKPSVPLPDTEGRQHRDARWDAAVRAARNRNAY